MSEGFESTRFESVEELMRYLKEKTDDIELVSIPVPATIQFTGPQGQRVNAPNCGGIVELCTGQRITIHRDDMQLLINDGILQRLSIPIELKPL